LRHASEAGAERSLITFAFNVVSQGLYVRHGLMPRVPIHLCSAPREALARRERGPTLRTTPIEATAGDIEALPRRVTSARSGSSTQRQCPRSSGRRSRSRRPATRDFGDWTRYLPRNPGFM
jgi:hypothetical protein